MKDPLKIHSDTEMSIFKFFYYFFLFLALPFMVLVAFWLFLDDNLNFSELTLKDWLTYLSAGSIPLYLAISRWIETKSQK